MSIERVSRMNFGWKKSFWRQSAHAVRIRLAAAALAVSGLLFVLYPVLRPFSDETSLFGAAAFASTKWIEAHELAMLAFILLTFGLSGLHLILRETGVERMVFCGLVMSRLGVGLTLPYYGAEAFGLHVIGQEAIRQQSAALVHLADDVRFGPGFSMILAGLVLLAIGSILTAAAVWKSRAIAKWSGVPFAIGFLLYLPQFLGTQQIRVAHGLLVAAGCLWIAMAMWGKLEKESSLNQALHESAD